MKPWKERLLNERAELMSKYTKLNHFRATANLDKLQMELLDKQSEIMKDYLNILDRRIKLL